MKKLILIALIAGAALPALSAADARDGCGPYAHRNAWGRCRPNGYGPGVVVGVPQIGVFYAGRGWWDGHRYWARRGDWDRNRWHGGDGDRWHGGDGDRWHGDHDHWDHHDH